MHLPFLSVHIALLCFIDTSSASMDIIFWYSVFFYVASFKSLKYWILHTNVNISSQTKKHFKGFFVHLFVYSKSCQVLTPNYKETIWGLFEYFTPRTKICYNYFSKDPVMKNNYWIQKFSQAGQFEIQFFLLYCTIEALLVYWST